MSSRVTGGVLRGRVLQAPKGQAVRPTSGRVREALFSILGQDLSGAAVLDLFAGAGTLGIEAASRGATDVTFVETDRDHGEVLRRNAAMIDGLAHWRLLRLDARRVHRLSVPRLVDLVFLDPPYGKGYAAPILDSLARGGLVAAGARIVAEVAAGTELPSAVGPFRSTRRRSYGRSDLVIFEREAT